MLSIADCLMARMEAERSPDWEYGIRLDLLRLLLELKGEQKVADDCALRPDTSAGSLSRVMPVVTRLLSEPGRPVSVAQAAAQCSLGVRRFSELFHEAMGQSFAHFSLTTRLAHAARLLVETDASVENVAARSGFADRTHLHHRFQEQYQCTPAEYRRRFRL